MLERGVVSIDEALREVEDCLPDPFRKLAVGIDILDVLLDQLATVGTQRGVQVLDRLHARKVDLPARLPHAVERAHDLLLAPDDIEQRKLAQPDSR